MPQFPLIRDAVKAFNVACIEQAGFEADDLIATYARRRGRQGRRRDDRLVRQGPDAARCEPGVVMLDGMKNEGIGHDEVIEKFGVPPDKVVDVQSLAGDSVDNVPGVPGIGIKTAAELIKEYGDLDTLLARAGEIKQPKRREKLIEFAEQARVSRELVRLKQDVPVEHADRALGVHDPDPTDAARLPARDGVQHADAAHRRRAGRRRRRHFPSPLAGEVARSAGGGYAARAADRPPPSAPSGHLPRKGGGEEW